MDDTFDRFEYIDYLRRRWRVAAVACVVALPILLIGALFGVVLVVGVVIAIVYAARGSDVRTTVVDGEVLVDEARLLRVDRAEVVAEARLAARELAARAGVHV